MLNWKTLSEEEFNRAVEMLIVRTVEADHPGLYATAVDGRGGDGGVDIDVRVKKTDQLVTIYQLKYFPEGFSGGWAATRKKQIRKSFQAAMEHEPPKWVLVIPGNYTPKERSFTTSLRENKPKPRIERIGKTELDIMLARFPEVEDYIKRNESLSALEIVGRESALLAKPGDVLTEVGLLEKRIQAQSIYWTRDFGSVGGQQFETIRALRPDAEDREPLTFTLITDFTGEEALGEQYMYALDYGLREPLRLPGKVVTKFEQHGPDWFAGVLGVNGIDLLPQPQDLAGPVKLVLRNEDGKTLAQPKALRAQVVSGAKGALLTVTVYPGLDLTIEFDRRPIGPGRINYQVMLQDLSGVEARQALRFLSALPNATTLAFEVDKVDPFSLTFAGVADPPPPGLVELADDLAAIEAELGVRFAFPETLPKAHERIWIRVIRRIFEGAVSFVPGTSALTFTVTGPFASGDNELLTDSAVNVGLHVDDWEWEILGQNIVVGDVTVGVFHGHAVDGADHLAALIADPEKSRSVTFVPGAALPGVLIYSLDRKKPDAVIEPSPWSLSNVSEHPYFAAVDDDQDSDTAA